MKRTNKKDRDSTAFLYVRLSRDDNLEGESNSISNQKKLLTKAAKDAGYTNIIIFADDGVSGVTMNRPGFQKMIAELEKDHAAAVFVKDMSRLGRNYSEAASVVRTIYDLFLAGKSVDQIAKHLAENSILSPGAYYVSKGINRANKPTTQGQTHWSAGTLINILTNQAYCGDVINFTTYSKSYKLKARIPNDPENWVIFKDVHEPIIDRAAWERVQNKRKRIRKRQAFDGEITLSAFTRTTFPAS